ncbi:DUF4351 domain-containing protein [Calothrix sp. 336/3]|nr:DUF4351 domain-containing protein [Calothrix sp. 336/3]
MPSDSTLWKGLILLETLGEALLDFTGLDDLVAWLAENPAN